MKKKISVMMTAAILMTGCSGRSSGSSSVNEKPEPTTDITTGAVTTEPITETVTEPTKAVAEPVLDRHTRYIDLTRQKNILYRKRESHETEYRMLGFGKITEEDGSIYLTASDGEKKLLVAPENDGETASIAFRIDDRRFVYTITSEETVTTSNIYDLEAGKSFVIEDTGGSYKYKPLYVSGDYLILYGENSSSGGRNAYFRLDINTNEIRKFDSEYISAEWKEPFVAFSPDGRNAATVSPGGRNGSMNEYIVTLFVPDTGEKLDEFVIGTTVDHSDFSLEFKDNNFIYVYAGRNDVSDWADLYIIDLWKGDGVIRINNSQEEYPDVKQLNIAEPDEMDSMNNNGDYIFFSDEGYYYNSYLSYPDRPRSALCYDSGNGEPVPIDVSEDRNFSWKCIKDGVLYGTCMPHVFDNADACNYYACKYENNEIKLIGELPGFQYVTAFTPEYIYYLDDKTQTKAMYRMDYNGKNRKKVFDVEPSIYDRNFKVNGSRVYYQWTDPESADEYADIFGFYDMETGENVQLKEGSVGRINGGYMYYLQFQNHNEAEPYYMYDLMRINLEDYSVERVCKNLWHYEFYGDSILYSRLENDNSSSLYRLDDNGSTMILNTGIMEDSMYSYGITGIQCRGDEIILGIRTAADYFHVVGIDSQGNLLKEYYEDTVKMVVPKT